MKNHLIIKRHSLFLFLILLFIVGCSTDDGDDRYFINPNLEAGCLSLQYPDMSSSEYVLPWEVGKLYEITGNCNTHGGERATQRYAYDIAMPTGTKIAASRSGVVVGVEEKFTNDNGSIHKLNYVFIQHLDGTIARYYHLTINGVLVALNDLVAQGDIIALSGSSGNPGYPHLHFDITSEECIERIELGGNLDVQSYCQTIAAVFSNTEIHTRGLEIGKYYEAFPY